MSVSVCVCVSCVHAAMYLDLNMLTSLHSCFSTS